MALPKLTTPTYELEIPSTDEKIKYRPFLVKEEKILMMAMESKSDADIELDLTEVNVHVGEDHTNKIELGNGMGMIMTYPTIDSFKDSGIRDINASNMLDVISGCIMQIYEEEGKSGR